MALVRRASRSFDDYEPPRFFTLDGAPIRPARVERLQGGNDNLWRVDLPIEAGVVVVRDPWRARLSGIYVIDRDVRLATHRVELRTEPSTGLVIDSDAIAFRVERDSGTSVVPNEGWMYVDGTMRVFAIYGDRREELIYGKALAHDSASRAGWLALLILLAALACNGLVSAARDTDACSPDV